MNMVCLYARLAGDTHSVITKWQSKNNAESKYICNYLSSLTLSNEVNKMYWRGFYGLFLSSRDYMLSSESCREVSPWNKFLLKKITFTTPVPPTPEPPLKPPQPPQQQQSKPETERRKVSWIMLGPSSLAVTFTWKWCPSREFLGRLMWSNGSVNSPHQVRICSFLSMLMSIPCRILEQKCKSSGRFPKPQWCIHASEIIIGGGGGFLVCWQGNDWQWLLNKYRSWKGPYISCYLLHFYFFFLWTMYFSSESVFIFLAGNIDWIIKLDHFHFTALENVQPLILQDWKSVHGEIFRGTVS